MNPQEQAAANKILEALASGNFIPQSNELAEAYCTLMIAAEFRQQHIEAPVQTPEA